MSKIITEDELTDMFGEGGKEEVKESFKQCEKCGEELGSKMVGDESFNYCKECNWVTM